MIEIPAYKDELRNTWYASFYYTDWQGKRRLKKKRGFQRKKDAQAFEEEFLRTRARSCDMTFRSFAEIYLGDMEPRLKRTTMQNKRYLIERRVLNRFIVGQVLLNDWMIGTIRRSLERHYPGVKMDDGEVRRILREEVFRHEIVEGPQAEDARRDVDAANARMRAAQKERRK